MSETAQRLGVTISTASGAVDHLVSVGLLSRVDDPANRRQVRVSVTPFGTETLEQMRELSARHLRAIVDAIGSDDLELVERAIHILTDAVPTATSPSTRSNQS
jgi:DNA-binding MarR family transcriptional regulator